MLLTTQLTKQHTQTLAGGQVSVLHGRNWQPHISHDSRQIHR